MHSTLLRTFGIKCRTASLQNVIMIFQLNNFPKHLTDFFKQYKDSFPSRSLIKVQIVQKLGWKQNTSYSMIHLHIVCQAEQKKDCINKMHWGIKRIRNIYLMQTWIRWINRHFNLTSLRCVLTMKAALTIIQPRTRMKSLHHILKLKLLLQQYYSTC